MAHHRVVIETDTSDENFARILARLGDTPPPPPPPPADQSGDAAFSLMPLLSRAGDQLSAAQTRIAAESKLRTARRRKRARRGTRMFGVVMQPSGKTTVLFGDGLRGARPARARRLQARRRKARRQAISKYIGETEKNVRRGWDWAREDGMSQVRTTTDGLLAKVTNKPLKVRRACGWMTGRRLALVALAVVTVVGVCMLVRRRRARASEEAA